MSVLEAALLISLACFIISLFFGYGLWVFAVYPFLRRCGVRVSIFYPRLRQYTEAAHMAKQSTPTPRWIALFRVATAVQVGSISVFSLAVIGLLLRLYLF